MALINTLRNKMGKFVVAVIAIAIISFVLNDLLGSNSMMTGQVTNVGEINGNEISIEQYQNIVDYQEKNFALYQNRQPTENDNNTINQRAWAWLIGQYAFKEQYEKVGIEVSSDELWDLQQGKNMDPTVKAFFSNPNTGEFDRDQFNRFIKNKSQRNAQSQYLWSIIYPSLRPGRERVKYENLLVKTSFVTEAEGMREYHKETDVAEARYLYIPFYSLSDSAVNSEVTDEILRKYYDEHKEDFKVEEQRRMKLVKFDIKPTPEDSAGIRQELTDLIEEFRNIQDDSLFAISQTDGEVAFGRYHRGDLPLDIEGGIEALETGTIYGPELESDSYAISKVVDIYEDTVFYTRASHILIKPETDSEEDKQSAKEEAERILNEIKNGANFALMAREHGTDGTAQRGGDLGWFSEGRMVGEFNDAVFSARSTGVLNNVIETDFGFHIIEVTEEKTNKRAAIARIERMIVPTKKTIDIAYRKADVFKSKVEDMETFESVAAEESIPVVETTDLNPLDRYVSALGNARTLVQWLFRDASVGTVSDVFEINDNYVVAVMTKKTEKGYQPFSEARSKILPIVKNQLKGEKIIKKLEGFSGSLEEIKASYGEGAQVYFTEELSFSSNSLPSVGFAPYAVGKVFSLEPGQISEPFISKDNGVLIVELVNKSIAPEVADYTPYKSSLQNNIQNRTSQNIESVIRENANIVDKRYRVF